MESHAIRHPDGDSCAETIHHYEFWREVATLTGKDSYDEATWVNGRLYFRSDFSRKMQDWPAWNEAGEWAAWIIEPTPEGNYNVLRSLKHERAKERSEEVEATFSKMADAGKYIILQVGDERRLALRLQTLFIKWEAAGLDPRIEVTSAGQQAVDDLVKRSPRLRRDFAQLHLKTYMLREDPSSYAIALVSRQPDMQVLALSYAELDEMLLDGMPEDVISKVSLG
ncbi:hypothetical protein LAUMK136_05549 [Mycobacterium attenuatum]|uniref:Uncharacterized protein n=1 Tax=Mycobacterium attenuatum TaxID=2341086 RepID=A0A498QHR7_9MYCO|nr:hypothetical protein [Mycobacterium attenuatum]VBA44284.1 hypothetical protein LAUMK136_05549 [Mycobacterium attenuatum]